MIRLIVFFFIAALYAIIARFIGFDAAILAGVTTIILFEIDRLMEGDV